MVTLVGQGLAGSLLGWELERRGVGFRIYDPGHATAASRVGAGIVNPLTGRRWVPTWRVEAWRDEAARCYDGLEAVLRPEGALRREMRLWRKFRTAEDRAFLAAKAGRPEVARWLGTGTEEGVWIRGAWQVDTAAIIAGLRARWREAGWLIEAPADAAVEAVATRTDPVIWCTGAALAGRLDPAGAVWQRAGGEIIEGPRAEEAWADDVMVNDGHWLLPLPGGRMRVGATYVRGQVVAEPTAAGRAELVEAGRRLGGGELVVDRHEAAVRVTTVRKRPVAGWWPGREGQGIFGALASKGALWAPILARQWAEHLTAGTGFDPEVAPPD